MANFREKLKFVIHKIFAQISHNRNLIFGVMQVPVPYLSEYLIRGFYHPQLYNYGKIGGAIRIVVVVDVVVAVTGVFFNVVYNCRYCHTLVSIVKIITILKSFLISSNVRKKI